MATMKVLPPERQCYGKQQHRTRRKAQDAKASLGYRGVDTYCCAHCGYWHVGHSTPKPKAEPKWSWHKWRVRG